MTRKLTAIFAALTVFSATFAGCSGKISDSEIKAKVTTAVENIKKVTAAKITTVSEASYTYDNSTTKINTTTEYIGININDPEKLEMSEEVSTTALNSTSGYEVYYKDGYYYTTRYKGAFKTKISADEAKITNYCPLSAIKYDDMKSVSSGKKVTSGDGDELVIDFSPKSSIIKKIINDTEEDAETYESISVTGAEGTYTIDKNGFIAKESLTFSANLEKDGEIMSVKMSTETTYADINGKLDPYDPEEEDYSEVDDLKTVAALNTAMSTTLSAESFDMKSVVSADITLNKKKYSYTTDYNRKYNLDDEVFFQEAVTKYDEEEKESLETVSAMYYTDGIYYNRSDQYAHKVFVRMNFSEFYSGIFTSTAITPAEHYSTAIMKNVTAKKDGDNTVYSFELNPESDGGKDFFNMIFSSYPEFSGDIDAAEIKVKKFSGKSYVDKNGNYTKTELSVSATVSFEEGDVTVKSTQTLEVDSIGESVKCKFPDFKDYTAMDKDTLFSAGASSAANTTA